MLRIRSDQVEVAVLDRSGGDISTAANRGAAESDASAQTSSVFAVGYSQVALTIDLTTVGSATTLYVAFRSSGMETPGVDTASDWSYYAIDDIDKATGVSATQPYEIEIPVDGVRRYTRMVPVWGSHVSALVWADGAGARGIVYAQRMGV